VHSIIETIDNQNRKIPIAPDDFTRDYVATLMKQLGKRDSLPLDDLTFGEMLEEIARGERKVREGSFV